MTATRQPLFPPSLVRTDPGPRAEGGGGPLSLALRVAVTASIPVCFGLLGLVAIMPPVRRRWRAMLQRYGVRARTLRIVSASVVIVATLLAVAAGLRATAAVQPPVLCHSTITADGDVQPEPLLDLATTGSATWHTIRSVVVAPASGAALVASSAIGMHTCFGPPVLVTFDWPADASGGSMIGDVFVTWMTDDAAPRGWSPIGTGAINRFGPDIPGDRASEETLGRHEARHVDQWAIGTIVAGPAAFPVAYGLDALVFPGARSHFERAASLEDGQYVVPEDFGPRPLWGPIGLLGLAGLLVGRRFRTLRRRAKAAGLLRR